MPGLGVKVREHVTGIPASSEGVVDPPRHSGVAWYNQPCGRCPVCRLPACHKRDDSERRTLATQCAVVVKVRHAVGA